MIYHRAQCCWVVSSIVLGVLGKDDILLGQARLGEVLLDYRLAVSLG